MDEDSRRFKLLVNVFGVYMITVGFAGIYFNWQFARTNGFVSWVLLGEVVPTAKAVVWPYFALRTHQQDKAEESLNHLFDALRQSQEAAKIINTAEPAASIYDMPGITRAVEHRRSAIAQIDQADAAVLDKVFPELGIRSHCQFRRAMELFVNGYERGSEEMLQRGNALNDEWADWYMQHQSQIEVAVNRAVRK